MTLSICQVNKIFAKLIIFSLKIIFIYMSPFSLLALLFFSLAQLFKALTLVSPACLLPSLSAHPQVSRILGRKQLVHLALPTVSVASRTF